MIRRSTLASLLIATASLSLWVACREKTEQAQSQPAVATTSTMASVPVQAAKETQNPANIAQADTTQAKPTTHKSRCPEGMVLINDSLCIDRFEGSLVEASGQPHSPYHPVGAKNVKAVSKAGVAPQAHISLEQADMACQRASKRICKDSEWVTACMGTGAHPRTYPYGRSEKKGACNDHRAKHPLVELHGRSVKPDVYAMNDPRINQLANGLAKTGEYSECATPEGVHDMVGNLLEWTIHMGKNGKMKAQLMGGYYVDSVENGKGCLYATVLHDAQYADYSTGFRCCASPGEFEVADEGTVTAAVVTKPAPAEEPTAAVKKPGDSQDNQQEKPAATPEPENTNNAQAPSAENAPSAQAQQAEPQPQSADNNNGVALANPLIAPKNDGPRDPPGFRSFLDNMAPMPPLPTPAGYDPPNAACPTDMALVSGKRCTNPIQVCLKPNTAQGAPKGSCLEFEKPSKCAGSRQPMRFCMDKYEYTPPGYTYPLVNVSWGEAQNVCNGLGKRLCEENEWEFACGGEEALPFPYGYVRNGEACHHDQPDLFDMHGKLNDQRVPTTSLPECKSPFGIFNIVGNVDEWTTRPGNKAPRRSILRGGWWLTGRNRCLAATSSHSEEYAGPQTSFRCCKAAK